VAASRRGLLDAVSVLPPPLAFEAEVVGGEEMMVATVNQRPFFLTPAELAGLRSFVQDQDESRDMPQMLMLTGTIKSGKTRVLETVLPGLLAARLAADPRSRRPVVFCYTFPVSAPADVAARNLLTLLLNFAASVGAPLPSSSAASSFSTYALDSFADLLLQLARHVHAEGGELWVLFDELQAPIVASTPADASFFVTMIKRAVELCSPFARIVGTGSGMVSLLTAVRDSAPNGFALWDAVAHVSLGRDPPAPVALAMAERILAARARSSLWPRDFAALLTPRRACDELSRDAHGGELTSPRPALVAYLAGLAGNAQSGTPEAVLKAAVASVLRKVRDESEADTITALIRMRPEVRMWLRALAAQDKQMLATQQRLSGYLSGNAVAAFASLLCEPSEPPRLMPPYGAQLQSLVTKQGELAVTRLSNGHIDFAYVIRKNLQLIAEHGGVSRALPHSMNARARAAASASVLAVLSASGIGVVKSGLAARAPQEVAEVLAVPAFSAVLAALDELSVRSDGPDMSPASAALASAARASPSEQTAFLATLGVRVLVWLRHFDAHVFFAAHITERSGLTTAVVAEAVRAAGEAIVREDGAFRWDDNYSGLLKYKPQTLRTPAATARGARPRSRGPRRN
jgi:hypothetical protein